MLTKAEFVQECKRRSEDISGALLPSAFVRAHMAMMYDMLAEVTAPSRGVVIMTEDEATAYDGSANKPGH